MIINMSKKLTERIKKIEDKLQVGRSIKIWDVKYRQEEESVVDIVTGKVQHPDGSTFSENGINYFVDIDMFAPKSQAENLKKKWGEHNAKGKN